MKTHHNIEQGNADDALVSALGLLLTDGEEVGSRQGDRNLEILMPRIMLTKPWQREILTPGRKASIAAQIAETMWVLAGRNDVEWLSHYLPRAAQFSDDGKTWRGGYGPRIRNWNRPTPENDQVYPGYDQLAHVVHLLNNERGTRRAVMSIYDPEIDSAPGKDIPCNDFITFISRLGQLHMTVTTRSNDIIWGWSGINQFEWSVLQEIVAGLTGNQVGTLTFNITSLHLYERHWQKARDILSRSRDVQVNGLVDSPRFRVNIRTVEHLDMLINQWFEIETAIRTGQDYGGMVEGFPEPMMQSWLRVIQWYWSTPDTGPWAPDLAGTRLAVAVNSSPARPSTRAKITTVEPDGTVTGEVTAEAHPGLYEMLTQDGVRGVRIRETQPDGTVKETPVKVGPLVESQEKILSVDLTSTRDKVAPLAWTTQFVKFVDNLHREKSAVYGDSWKKRGELTSILANIARKVDRLGVGGAGDSSADTVIDLLVYLIKYRLWINDNMGVNQAIPDEAENDAVAAILDQEDRINVKVVQRASLEHRFTAIKEYFEFLHDIASEKTNRGTQASLNSWVRRADIVDDMIRLAFPAARLLWGEENGHLLKPSQAAELFTVPLDALAAAGHAARRAVVQEANKARRWEGYEAGENLD